MPSKSSSAGFANRQGCDGELGSKYVSKLKPELRNNQCPHQDCRKELRVGEDVYNLRLLEEDAARGRENKERDLQNRGADSLGIRLL